MGKEGGYRGGQLLGTEERSGGGQTNADGQTETERERGRDERSSGPFKGNGMKVHRKCS